MGIAETRAHTRVHKPGNPNICADNFGNTISQSRVQNSWVGKTEGRWAGRQLQVHANVCVPGKAGAHSGCAQRNDSRGVQRSQCMVYSPWSTIRRARCRMQGARCMVYGIAQHMNDHRMYKLGLATISYRPQDATLCRGAPELSFVTSNDLTSLWHLCTRMCQPVL